MYWGTINPTRGHTKQHKHKLLWLLVSKPIKTNHFWMTFFFWVIAGFIFNVTCFPSALDLFIYPRNCLSQCFPFSSRHNGVEANTPFPPSSLSHSELGYNMSTLNWVEPICCNFWVTVDGAFVCIYFLAIFMLLPSPALFLMGQLWETFKLWDHLVRSTLLRFS